MSDVKKVLEAMAALTRTLGHVNVTVSAFPDYTSISLGCDDDSTAHSLANVLNIELSLTNNEKSEWIRGSGDIGDLSVFVFGEHRPIVRRDIDASAALAQAQEALS